MSAPHLAARALAVAALVIAALVAAPAPAATPAEVTYGNKTFGLVNKVRADHSLKTLKKQKCLQRFAVKQAVAMAKQRRMFHQDLYAVLEACNLGTAAENVAEGNVSPSRIVQGWMNSPDHEANILRPTFRISGLAARKAGGRWWVAQVFGRKL